MSTLYTPYTGCLKKDGQNFRIGYNRVPLRNKSLFICLFLKLVEIQAYKVLTESEILDTFFSKKFTYRIGLILDSDIIKSHDEESPHFIGSLFLKHIKLISADGRNGKSFIFFAQIFEFFAVCLKDKLGPCVSQI